ncbi:hypothetical protein RB195_011562 [Necator americanus]|uniref:Uncharacterized protein n=1 Tax=Necator americanus TaxID=51031 RepID=A0ABR1D4C5_NECAM
MLLQEFRATLKEKKSVDALGKEQLSQIEMTLDLPTEAGVQEVSILFMNAFEGSRDHSAGRSRKPIRIRVDEEDSKFLDGKDCIPLLI